MPDENNPVIYVEYSADAFPPTNWTDLKTYAVDFNVKNSGILKTPECTLTLKNTNGRYTGNGTLTLGLNKILRIRTDVRGTIDTLFYGRIAPLDSKNEKQKNEYLTVTARGMLQKLLNDSITHNYLDDKNIGIYDWNMKQVIESLLVYTDSGEASGITLYTDPSFPELTTVKAKHNFDRESLLDAIKKIAEYVGYTGYEEVHEPEICLYLYPYGWQPTNPAITIGQEADNLGNQVIKRGRSINPDDIYNHICVQGGSSIYYPDSDRFTENGVSGVGKGWWTAGAGCTVSDDATAKQVNSNSIKILASANAQVKATLNLIPTFGASGLNTKTKKLSHINFWLYRCGSGYEIMLTDTSNRYITYQTSDFEVVSNPPASNWRSEQVQIGQLLNNEYQNLRIEDAFWYGRWYGNPDFDWQQVANITYRGGTRDIGTLSENLDGFCFSGWIVSDPIKDPTLAATDAASIALYGRRIMHYEDPALRDYDAIRPMADKIILSTKDPVTKLTVTVGAKTWVKPNQYLTVNIPIYGISSQQYRIVELEYEWSTKTKLLRSTLSLTPRYQPVTSREWYASQLDGILKNLIW